MLIARKVRCHRCDHKSLGQHGQTFVIADALLPQIDDTVFFSLELTTYHFLHARRNPWPRVCSCHSQMATPAVELSPGDTFPYFSAAFPKYAVKATRKNKSL